MFHEMREANIMDEKVVLEATDPEFIEYVYLTDIPCSDMNVDSQTAGTYVESRYNQSRLEAAICPGTNIVLCSYSYTLKMEFRVCPEASPWEISIAVST